MNNTLFQVYWCQTKDRLHNYAVKQVDLGMNNKETQEVSFEEISQMKKCLINGNWKHYCKTINQYQML